MNTPTHQTTLDINRLQKMLDDILAYWMRETIDEKNGGFIGQIDAQENKNWQADKGSVLHARILYTFSEAYQLTGNTKYLYVAEWAYRYIETNFYHKNGIYWSVTATGVPSERKNQIYALAFTIYGCASYYAVSKNAQALAMANDLLMKIEKYSFDSEYNGYFEAFTENWKPLSDFRLSDKDVNEKKTMNTHLHIVEAYANLYKVAPSAYLKERIQNLLDVIEEHFINKKQWHLNLFFSETWTETKSVISFGHDIEAAWLLLWCAEQINDENYIERYREIAVGLAKACFKGVDSDGGLWYEFDLNENKLIREKHWWPQAEFWLGMHCAYNLTNDEKFLNAVIENLAFTEKYILDRENGEWLWGILEDKSKMNEDKVGIWKCPYHNGRACMELINILKENK